MASSVDELTLLPSSHHCSGVPVVVAGSGVVAAKVDAHLRGESEDWTSWPALRGSIGLAAVVIAALALAGIASGIVAALALAAGLAHYFGLVDVGGLVYKQLKV